jgi:hypothetical protein
MSAVHEALEAPLDREQLDRRWQAQVEIYGRDGRRAATSFAVDPAGVFK